MGSGGVDSEEASNYDNGGGNHKPKIVVIMGPTGSGKSRLAIDLAVHLPIEIINADSMQVYQGLDVLTNKVTISEQKGVEHHLLGTISPSVEFTCKSFRDAAAPLINDIISRNHLPVIVGGTNFYIQALVSPFLLDDQVEDINDEFTSDSPEGDQPGCDHDGGKGDDYYSFVRLKAIDPLAANRIHPNDHRKVKQYIDSFERFGIPPSKLFQGKNAEVDLQRVDISKGLSSTSLELGVSSAATSLSLGIGLWQNWGRLANSRYDCCFICVDASLAAIDKYVDERVDRMIDAGLLEEVYDVYTLNADYSRGLRQAIGVREFEEFLSVFFEAEKEANGLEEKLTPAVKSRSYLKERMVNFLHCSSSDDPKKRLLQDGISKLKVNTQRLVRRQKRRVNRLRKQFGWNIHYVDSTETLLGSSGDSWMAQVVKPSTDVIRSFLNGDTVPTRAFDEVDNTTGMNVVRRDLWTQYVCEACGNRVLRGEHEWEQHRQGRAHRKRVSSLRKQSRRAGE